MNNSLEEKIFSLFDEATLCLQQSLLRVKIPIECVEEEELARDVLAVVSLLAFACYGAAETFRVLIRTNITYHLSSLLRQQYEAAICASYISTIDQTKARDYILLDDFERFYLTREANISTQYKTEVEDECFQTLNQFPELVTRLKDGRDLISGKKAIDGKILKRIRDMLKLPNVRAMASALEKHHPGFTGHLHTISYQFGSLTTHPNIVALRRAFKHHALKNADFISLSLDLREPGAPDFALQSMNNVIGLGQMLDTLVDAAFTERQTWNSIIERQQVLTVELNRRDSQMCS